MVSPNHGKGEKIDLDWRHLVNKYKIIINDLETPNVEIKSTLEHQPNLLKKFHINAQVIGVLNKTACELCSNKIMRYAPVVKPRIR